MRFTQYYLGCLPQASYLIGEETTGRAAVVDPRSEDMARQLYRSPHTRLLCLPDATRVYPAHGAASACGKNLSTETVSTSGEQRRTNHAPRLGTVEQFVEAVTKGQPPRPGYLAPRGRGQPGAAPAAAGRPRSAWPSCGLCDRRARSSRWNAPATGAPDSSRRPRASSGGSARRAPPSGPACRSPRCWTGGVRAAAREGVFSGADRGEVDGRDGRVHFERSMTVGQLGQAGALLAYAMNGEELPLYHGYPLRLVVPGWYTVASVKWLTEIEVIAKPFDGFFQVDRYHIDGDPVSLQRVQSLIIQPAAGETAEPGDITIRGVAWSGAAPIARVEVAIDDAPWQPATPVGERRRHSWQWWKLPVGTSGPGTATIRARATDLAGRTQPDQPPWNALGYANNAVHQVSLAVGAGRSTELPLR